MILGPDALVLWRKPRMYGFFQDQHSVSESLFLSLAFETRRTNLYQLPITEGSWDQVVQLIGFAHTLTHQQGIARVQTDIRIETRYGIDSWKLSGSGSANLYSLA